MKTTPATITTRLLMRADRIIAETGTAVHLIHVKARDGDISPVTASRRYNAAIKRMTDDLTPITHHP